MYTKENKLAYLKNPDTDSHKKEYINPYAFVNNIQKTPQNESYKAKKFLLKTIKSFNEVCSNILNQKKITNEASNKFKPNYENLVPKAAITKTSNLSDTPETNNYSKRKLLLKNFIEDLKCYPPPQFIKIMPIKSNVASICINGKNITDEQEFQIKNIETIEINPEINCKGNVNVSFQLMDEMGDNYDVEGKLYIDLSSTENKPLVEYSYKRTPEQLKKAESELKLSREFFEEIKKSMNEVDKISDQEFNDYTRAPKILQKLYNIESYILSVFEIIPKIFKDKEVQKKVDYTFSKCLERLHFYYNKIPSDIIIDKELFVENINNSIKENINNLSIDVQDFVKKAQANALCFKDMTHIIQKKNQVYFSIARFTQDLETLLKNSKNKKEIQKILDTLKYLEDIFEYFNNLEQIYYSIEDKNDLILNGKYLSKKEQKEKLDKEIEKMNKIIHLGKKIIKICGTVGGILLLTVTTLGVINPPIFANPAQDNSPHNNLLNNTGALLNNTGALSNNILEHDYSHDAFLLNSNNNILKAKYDQKVLPPFLSKNIEYKENIYKNACFDPKNEEIKLINTDKVKISDTAEVINCKCVSMRNGPSITSKKVSFLQKGAIVKVIEGPNNDFVKVSTKYTSGKIAGKTIEAWIHKKFLKINKVKQERNIHRGNEGAIEIMKADNLHQNLENTRKDIEDINIGKGLPDSKHNPVDYEYKEPDDPEYKENSINYASNSESDDIDTIKNSFLPGLNINRNGLTYKFPGGNMLRMTTNFGTNNIAGNGNGNDVEGINTGNISPTFFNEQKKAESSYLRNLALNFHGKGLTVNAKTNFNNDGSLGDANLDTEYKAKSWLLEMKNALVQKYTNEGDNKLVYETELAFTQLIKKAEGKDQTNLEQIIGLSEKMNMNEFSKKSGISVEKITKAFNNQGIYAGTESKLSINYWKRVASELGISIVKQDGHYKAFYKITGKIGSDKFKRLNFSVGGFMPNDRGEIILTYRGIRKNFEENFLLSGKMEKELDEHSLALSYTKYFNGLLKQVGGTITYNALSGYVKNKITPHITDSKEDYTRYDVDAGFGGLSKIRSTIDASIGQENDDNGYRVDFSLGGQSTTHSELLGLPKKTETEIVLGINPEFKTHVGNFNAKYTYSGSKQESGVGISVGGYNDAPSISVDYSNIKGVDRTESRLSLNVDFAFDNVKDVVSGKFWENTFKSRKLFPQKGNDGYKSPNQGRHVESINNDYTGAIPRTREMLKEVLKAKKNEKDTRIKFDASKEIYIVDGNYTGIESVEPSSERNAFDVQDGKLIIKANQLTGDQFIWVVVNEQDGDKSLLKIITRKGSLIIEFPEMKTDLTKEQIYRKKPIFSNPDSAIRPVNGDYFTQKSGVTLNYTLHPETFERKIISYRDTGNGEQQWETHIIPADPADATNDRIFQQHLADKTGSIFRYEVYNNTNNEKLIEWKVKITDGDENIDGNSSFSSYEPVGKNGTKKIDTANGYTYSASDFEASDEDNNPALEKIVIDNIPYGIVLKYSNGDSVQVGDEIPKDNFRKFTVKSNKKGTYTWSWKPKNKGGIGKAVTEEITVKQEVFKTETDISPNNQDEYIQASGVKLNYTFVEKNYDRQVRAYYLDANKNWQRWSNGDFIIKANNPNKKYDQRINGSSGTKVKYDIESEGFWWTVEIE